MSFGTCEGCRRRLGGGRRNFCVIDAAPVQPPYMRLYSILRLAGAHDYGGAAPLFQCLHALASGQCRKREGGQTRGQTGRSVSGHDDARYASACCSSALTGCRAGRGGALGRGSPQLAHPGKLVNASLHCCYLKIHCIYYIFIECNCLILHHPHRLRPRPLPDPAARTEAGA